MDETKKKFALWAYPTTLEKVERLYRLDNCRSKSEFIEKAVLFYAGYVCTEDCREYFPEAIVSTIQGSLDSFENRMASLRSQAFFHSFFPCNLLLSKKSDTYKLNTENLLQRI